MDPDVTLDRIIWAAVNGDPEEFLAATRDMQSWLDKGGYPPKDPHRECE